MIKLASFFRVDFQKFDGMVIFSCKSFFWEIWLSTENKKVILHSWCIFDTLLKLAYARFTKFILSQNSSVDIQLNETSFVNRLSKLVSKIKYAQKKIFPH